jgi:hypothetical protein
VIFTKRVIRRLVAWYVQPIAEDQTRFNTAAIRLMRRLERRLEARIMEEGYAAALRSWVGDLESRLFTDVESVAEFLRVQSRRMERIEALVASHDVVPTASGTGLDAAVAAFAVESLAGLRGARVLVIAPGNALLPALLAALGHDVSSDGPSASGGLDAAVLSWDSSRSAEPDAVGAEIDRARGAVRGGGRCITAVPARAREAAAAGLDASVQRFAVVARGGSWRILDESPDPSEDAMVLTAGTTRL